MNTRFLSWGVAISSFATIALEMALTRIYSVTMYYHFAYMVISLALLGMAISGVVIYLLPKFFTPQRAGLLAAVFMLLFAASTLWALSAALHNPISLSNWSANRERLFNIYLPAGCPFLCSGVALSLAIASAKEKIGRIYAFDLIGAAIGCIAIIPALPLLGGPGTIVFIGACGALGAIFLVLAGQKDALTRPIVVAGALAASVLAFYAITEQSAHRFGLARNPEKFLGTNPVLFEKWNALSQITVARADYDHNWIYIDADAATRLWSGAVKKDGYAATRRAGEIRVASLVYGIRHDGTALIIGPGGGTDVISALYRGVPKVVGVEVNPLIVNSVMHGAYADYSGHLYDDPRVDVHVDEGRSYVRRSEGGYQSIQATLVDTWAASTSGAFTLSENNLYTVEAFEEFLQHLRPDGLLAVTRWYNAGEPREFLRLISVGRAALERRGVAPIDVRKHMLLATDNDRRACLIMGRSELTAEDLKSAVQTAKTDNLRFLYAPPGSEVPTEGVDRFLASFIEAPSSAEFLSKLSYNATAPTDDKPFFFYTLRPSDLSNVVAGIDHLERNNLGIAILMLLLGISAALTLALVILPLLLFRRDAITKPRGPKLRLLGYFLALGLGFILVELGFMQQFVLFLGHPIYALAVVLAVLLGSSGTGAALSGWGCARWGLQGFVRRVVIALGSVLLVYALGLGHVFHALVGLVLPIRIFVAALLVLVPGLLMGALLPSGVRGVNETAPDLVPWAWGLNGAASVVGSVLAMLLSMNYGFSASLLCGIIIYAIGMAAFPPSSDLMASAKANTTEKKDAEPEPATPEPEAPQAVAS
jgi:predicted membrane-bound spermidine synthase